MSPARLFRIDKACHHYRALLNTVGTTEAPAPGTELVPSGAHSNTQSILSTAWCAPGLADALLTNCSCTGKVDFDQGHMSAGLASCSRNYSGIEEIKNPVSSLLQASSEILGKPSSLSLSQHANIPSFSRVQDTHGHHKYFQEILASATWSTVQLNSSGFLAVRGTDTLSRPLPEMEILFPLCHYTANLPLHQRVLEIEGISLRSTQTYWGPESKLFVIQIVTGIWAHSRTPSTVSIVTHLIEISLRNTLASL